MISDLEVFQNCWQESYPVESGREESREMGSKGMILEKLGKNNLGKQRRCLEGLEKFICCLNSACEKVSDKYPFDANRSTSDNVTGFVI